VTNIILHVNMTLITTEDWLLISVVTDPKSCKRTDSDGFVKKSADPDSVSDS